MTFPGPWKANADRVLEALGLDLRMGDREDALRCVAAGACDGTHSLPAGSTYSLPAETF